MVLESGTRGAWSSPEPWTTLHRTTLAFVKGNASFVDIDHVVALGNAWVRVAAPERASMEHVLAACLGKPSSRTSGRPQ